MSGLGAEKDREKGDDKIRGSDFCGKMVCSAATARVLCAALSRTRVHLVDIRVHSDSSCSSAGWQQCRPEWDPNGTCCAVRWGRSGDGAKNREEGAG